MTDDEFEAQKERVLAALIPWLKRLGLGWYRIEHKWERDQGSRIPGSAFATGAVVETQWEYRQAQINWYLPTLALMDDEALDNLIVHELVHILCDPMQTFVPAEHKKLEEYATECLARAIIGAWQDGQEKLEVTYQQLTSNNTALFPHSTTTVGYP